MQKLLNMCEQRIRWTLEALSFLHPGIRRLKIKLVIREDIGAAAGYAEKNQRVIELNRTLLEANPEYFLRQIIPHEVCHIVDGVYWEPEKPHGPNWVRLMQILNLPAHAYHHLNTDICKLKDPDVFVYRCKCQHGSRHEVTGRAHALRKKRDTLCTLCDTPYVFSHIRELRTK